MSERRLIEEASAPVTVTSLEHDLRTLGVALGATVLVHASLSSLGWVCGGAPAVVLALEHALAPSGTLVMPTHSASLGDPARWENPPVPESWWPVIREEMPGFDADLTPSEGMGAIAECFRKQRGVYRSGHPQVSFAAWGAGAEQLTQGHGLDHRLGERSPLARVYDAGGSVLLLGVDHSCNTSLHLAEYRADWPGKRACRMSAPVVAGGTRRWTEWDDIELDSEDFPAIGDSFACGTGLQRQGAVGRAAALLVPQRPLVDAAVEWMEANRS